MKITLDIKTLVIGFLLGALFMCALGAAGGASSASFGIAVPSGGWALIKSERDRAYIINETAGTATPVKFLGKSKSEIQLF